MTRHEPVIKCVGCRGKFEGTRAFALHALGNRCGHAPVLRSRGLDCTGIGAGVVWYVANEETAMHALASTPWEPPR